LNNQSCVSASVGFWEESRLWLPPNGHSRQAAEDRDESVARQQPNYKVAKQMFYRMSFDSKLKHQSFISPIRVGNAEVNESELIRHAGPIAIADRVRGAIAQIGTLRDINFGSHDILICSEEATQTLKKVDPSELQSIPIDINGATTSFYLIHLLSIIDCIDRKASQYTLWTESSFRPELAGEFEMMMKMVVDPAKIGGHKIFRAKGWEITIVVHETIKRALEDAGLSGAAFGSLDL
jgi:hypothetical protein